MGAGAGAEQRVAIAITGATATGKTALALEIARRLGGEIISADSRQVYRGLDIGTAKPTPEQLATVPHHGVDLIEPDQRYSAGQFARDAHHWIEEIRARKGVPILVGGTGFFLKALTAPLFAEPEMPAARREQLKRYFESKPPDQLRRWLQTIDRIGARTRDLVSEGGDPQRMARALEVMLLTGHTLDWWHANAPPVAKRLQPLSFLLELPRDELYQRINQRVLQMIEQGLVEEVRGLVDRGYDEQTPGLKTTGYIELLAYLRGETDLASGIDAIQRATRRYARRQTTWFRHQLPADTIRLDARESPEWLADQIAAHWQRR